MIFQYRYYIYDLSRLIAALYPTRVVNYLTLLVSYYFSRITKRAWVPSRPFSLHLELASICNLKCPECPAGTGRTLRNSKQMVLDTATEKILLHKRTTFYCNLYFQGEPFLNRRWMEIVMAAKKAGMYTVISTNGHFLSPENCEKIIKSGLDRIIISIDGIREETYKSYRIGGNFQQVISGVSELVKTRKSDNSKSPLIVVQYLVNKANENDIPKAASLIKDMGVDVLQYKSMQIYSNEGMEKFKPKTIKYNRYEKDGDRTEKKLKGTACMRLWSHAVYTSDGDMVPCCFDKTPDFPVGKSEKEGQLLWHTKKMQNFRKHLLSQKEPPKICRNCSP